MESEYKPLFNRTYLKILLWLVAVAIVLLSALNQQNRIASPEPFQEQPWLASLEDEQATQARIYLTYALPPAYNPTAQLRQRALRDALTQVLQRADQLQGQLFADRLQLSIAVQDTDQLDTQMQRLTESVTRALPDALSRAQATQYLETQASEAFALYNLKLQLANSGPAITDSVQLFNYRPTVLVVAQQQDQTLLKRLQQRFDSSPIYGESRHAATAATQVVLQHRDRKALTLLAADIHSATAPPLVWPLALRYLQQELPTLFSGAVTYRLVLTPGAPGFAALVLSADSSLSREQQRKLWEHFEALSTSQLEVGKAQLAKLNDRQLSELEGRVARFAATQFYGQPLNLPVAFRDTLAAIDTAQVQQALQRLLDPNQNIRILVEPQ